MRAFGSDRVRQGDGEQWLLFARRSKGWLPRAPKTLTRSEHPGTAVLWEERLFEVVAAEPLAPAGVRYVLEPWHDQHIIRVSEAYDEESETRRETEYRAAMAREKGRKTANLAGVFTGLLPASVQEQLGSEVGILPTKLTSLSLLVPLAYLIWFANHYVYGVTTNTPTALPLMLVAMYLFIESAIRIQIAWFHRRPIGSAIGFIPYLLFYVLGGRRAGAASPFEVPRGQRLYVTEPPDDVALRDAYAIREPLLTLLSVAEQNALSDRFGFDYRKHGRVVAWVILASSIAGIASSLGALQGGPRLSAFVSFLVAVGLGAEQVLRLQAMRGGPSPSVLAFFVRPFTRKLLR